MELPRRERGDELLPPGALLDLRRRLRSVAGRSDLTSVIAYAFDPRTHMLPFFHSATRMVPAGVRAIGAAMLDAGFEKTRIVLQQWNPRFRPSRMQIDGRIPDLFMVSSMQIHTEACRDLIRDACRIDPAHRPLIIAGGPTAIYEPWSVYNPDPADPWGADVVVTGEEYVLLDLLSTLLAIKATHESIRSTFLRARSAGLLDGIAGLVYPITDRAGVAETLIDTGVQRLLGDLDELPHPVLGYRLLERPSRSETLASRAIPTREVGRYSPIGSLVLTFGCKFACPYCPIPAYNQRQHRLKSPERIVDEFRRLNQEYGIRSFFGADDNFFNHKARTLEIVEALARTEIDGVPIRKRVRWGTEVTIHDTLQMSEHLSTVRRAGVRALWLGVEDMTATLVKKGQSVDKTLEAFRLLRKHGICPMPMMMHYDEQPLVSRGGPPRGLLNQVGLLRKAGAIGMQVLMIVPAPGSKLFIETYTTGLAYERVGGKTVTNHMLGGNYVIASRHPKPWRKQLNILAAYLYFYNPIRFLFAFVRPKSRLYLADAFVQFLGMTALVVTIRRTIGWAFRLRFGRIERKSSPPVSSIPMRTAGEHALGRALPGTPVAVQPHVGSQPLAVGPMLRG